MANEADTRSNDAGGRTEAPRRRRSDAVLLLGHGGPASLDDIPGFLRSVMGRAPSPEIIERVTERYRLIGGSSPVLAVTRNLAAKLAETCDIRVYPAMLHWHPLIEDVVPLMAACRISRALAVCLVPQYSSAGVGPYETRTAAAAAEEGLAIEVVPSWHDEPAFVGALADSLAPLLAAPGGGSTEGAATGASGAHVVFTAHSLPKVAVPADDPYQTQLVETAQLVAGRLGLAASGWTLAYQGAVPTAGAWLGPSVQEIVADLAAQGIARVIVCPIGFVLDHVETLYDLDIALREQAAALGVELLRPAALNDGEPLVQALAAVVGRRLAGVAAAG